MKATKIGHWPNQDVPCCEAHAKQMQATAQAMGFSVSFTDCGPEELCISCQNKELKEKL
jgi:hypothetical protein